MQFLEKRDITLMNAPRIHQVDSKIPEGACHRAYYVKEEDEAYPSYFDA